MTVLNKLFEKYTGIAPENIIPLTGSGSNRQYFRLESEGKSLIGVVGTDKQENAAFIALAKHFASKGILVPQILAQGEDGLSYLQQDLGTELLAEHVAAAGKAGEYSDELVDLLCRTMAALPKIQFEGAQGLDFNICYPQPAFDRRMLMFDLNYFKYCFLKPAGIEFNEVYLEDEFEKLSEELLEDDSPTFLYRDFQARNVMVYNGEPYFIDFQGGRRGPIYYDVASFVYQARANYPQWLKSKMIESYLASLSCYMEVDRKVFDERLNLYVFFRTLQVLGAYGFRGLIEHKAQFITTIPKAVQNLKESLEYIGKKYTYLYSVLKELTQLQRFNEQEEDGILEVKVYSFSYKKGIPQDLSGNGGGYVFDCRSIHNPGRYEQYKKLTGRDEDVMKFLEEDGEILAFLKHVYGLVDPHVETYHKRGFTNLQVCFGCTGGQHRSVYCADHLARHLAEKYPEIRVRLIHKEREWKEEVL